MGVGSRLRAGCPQNPHSHDPHSCSDPYWRVGSCGGGVKEGSATPSQQSQSRLQRTAMAFAGKNGQITRCPTNAPSGYATAAIPTQSRARFLLTQWWTVVAYHTHHHAAATTTTMPTANDWTDVALNTPHVAPIIPAAAPATALVVFESGGAGTTGRWVARSSHTTPNARPRNASAIPWRPVSHGKNWTAK